MGEEERYFWQCLFDTDGRFSEKPIRFHSPREMRGDKTKERRNTMIRLSEYGTQGLRQPAERLEDIQGQEVTVLDFRLASGQFGEYAFVDVVDELGNEHTVITGSFYVLDALKDAKAKNALPCQAKFVKSGRAWTIE